MKPRRWRPWRLYLDVSSGYLWAGWRCHDGAVVALLALPVPW